MATLKVTIHEARDLPVMDRATGLADPYVVVSLNAESYTTEIDSGTCNPIWNKDVRFDAANLLTLQEDPLELRVYDHDIVTRDDLIGLLFLDLNSILGREIPTLSGWFPLYDTMAGLRGELRVTLKVKFHASENPTVPRAPVRSIVAPIIPESTVLPASLWAARSSLDDANGGSLARSINPLHNGGGGQGQQPKSSGPPGASNAASSSLGALTSPLLQFHVDVESSKPLRCIKSHQPSLTTEEEGVHLFSMSRLDPTIFRVESMLSMVEELIVKADPEHSKFTNLRSSRATNEARVLQLYKLSGKVRRQLSRKVLELQCNAVLGYEERYDLEPNGIIVRAYGTPCVVSAIKVIPTVVPPPILCLDAEGPRHDEHHGSVTGMDRSMATVELLSPASNLPFEMVGSSSYTFGVTTATNSTVGGTLPTAHHDFDEFDKLIPATLAAGGGGTTLSNAHPPEMHHLIMNAPTAGAATRSPVITLTVKDVPSGVLHHIGGMVAARSVKLISKQKNKLSISQERDAWWSELREEIKYNARTLHCNAIMAYEEIAMYDHEDVAMLSISGTAVVVDTTWLAMRCGPENLFYRMYQRHATSRACSMLHLYHPHHHHHRRAGDAGGGGVGAGVGAAMPGGGGGAGIGSTHAAVSGVGAQPQTPHTAINSTDGGAVDGYMCTICRKKPVPDVILSSAAVPLDLITEGSSVYIQAAVAKTKPNVKGAELALCLSQAIPFLEFSLHKQLLFKLQLEHMNAAFGVRVSFAVGADVILATLTATGFRVHGLPVPLAPRLDIWEDARLPPEAVARLQSAVETARLTASLQRNSSARRLSLGRALQRSLRPTSSAHPHTINGAIKGHRSVGASPGILEGMGLMAVSATPSDSFCCYQPPPNRTATEPPHTAGSRSNSPAGSDSDSSNTDSAASKDTWLSSSSSEDEADLDGGGCVSFPSSSGCAGWKGSGGIPSGTPSLHGASESVVVIDDEEEAELMLGVVTADPMDRSHIRLDDIALSVPYSPVEAQWFCQFQERLSLSRRYSVGGDSKRELTTTFLNQCLANVRMSLMMHLRRTALRHNLSLRDEIRVFQLRLHCVFEPNTNDLHVVLDGLVCGAPPHHSSAHRQQVQLVLRAFQDAQAALRIQLPSFTANRGSPATTRHSTGKQALGENHVEGTSSDDAGIAVVKATNAWMSSMPHPGKNMARLQAAAPYHRSARCLLFQLCAAPFSLPFVFRRDATGCNHDPFSVLEGRAVGFSTHGGEAKMSDRATVAEQAKRTGVIRRQLQALTNLASATLRNFADRVGMGPEVTAAHEKERGPVGSAATGAAKRGFSASEQRSAARDHMSSVHTGVQQLVHPCSRVPQEQHLLSAFDDALYITPLCFVPGSAIVRYIGRISQHFIREAYEVYTAEALGMFHAHTDMEVHGVVRSLIRAMGGNALLSHHVQLHEVWDSDGSGCAFLCLSVTGHVAWVTREAANVNAAGGQVSS